MRKRFYILFVARDGEGELRKIPIPLHYAYVFLAGALLGMLTITGMVGSYTRMLMKVTRFNQLRTEQNALKHRYDRLEQVAREKDMQVASLGSLASEVSALYGLKPEPVLVQAAADDTMDDQEISSSITQLTLLRNTALTGAATVGIGLGGRRAVTATDWLHLAAAPTLWPVEGPITGSFGERIDPFNGEGAFHRGVDISSTYGAPIVAPADGVVTYAGPYNGYGRLVVIEHGSGVATRYGHLSAFNVAIGQVIQRGAVLGYVGLSGRSTGPHLHYEVWLKNTPVNPYKYLRLSQAQMWASASKTPIGHQPTIHGQ